MLYHSQHNLLATHQKGRLAAFFILILRVNPAPLYCYQLKKNISPINKSV